MNGIIAPNPDSGWPWPVLAIEPAKVVALTESLFGVKYRMGAKADPLSLQAGEIEEFDCSGFARWCLFHAIGPALFSTVGPNPLFPVPDGSENQHEWVKKVGFKASTFEKGKLGDRIVRIAFLEPKDGEAGHVVLIVNGLTCECHAAHPNQRDGVDRRVWGSMTFMERMSVYALTRGSL